MNIFSSNATITISTLIVVFAIILISLKTSPHRVAKQFVLHLLRSRIFAVHLVLLLGMLGINKLELFVEQKLNFNYDFTKYIFAIEGPIVRYIQEAFHHIGLTSILAFFYVIVFPGLMIASIAIYTFKRNYALYYAFCYAIMINYIVAIPFYLFFPVNEAWSYIPSGITFYMLEVYPSFEETYRNMSGLDNCFPSLHTSLSVTIALLAYHSGLRAWRWIAGVSAGIVIFSIFYLGIHWIIDMLAGSLLGWFAVRGGLHFSEKFQFHTRTMLPVRTPFKSNA